MVVSSIRQEAGGARRNFKAVAHGSCKAPKVTAWTIVTQSGIDTLNMSQGVEIKVKQSSQIQNPDSLPLN
jgi:hypothetical protein